MPSLWFAFACSDATKSGDPGATGESADTTPAPVGASGTWTGSCSGDITLTGTTGGTTRTFVFGSSLDLSTTLHDADGWVTGSADVTLFRSVAYGGSTYTDSSGAAWYLEGPHSGSSVRLDATLVPSRVSAGSGSGSGSGSWSAPSAGSYGPGLRPLATFDLALAGDTLTGPVLFPSAAAYTTGDAIDCSFSR